MARLRFLTAEVRTCIPYSTLQAYGYATRGRADARWVHHAQEFARRSATALTGRFDPGRPHAQLQSARCGLKTEEGWRSKVCGV